MIPERVTWAVTQLNAAATDKLLEVGCGAGHALSLLSPILKRGSITGIDRSALQVEAARKRNQEQLALGRLRIEQLTLERAPAVLGERLFSKTLAINVNAFWTTPESSIASLQRLLRPGGQLFLVYEPPTSARLRVLRGSLPKLLSEHGLVIEDVRTARFSKAHGLCVVGRAPG